MNPVELFRQETALLQLGLDEIVVRATRELRTCGDSDTVQRANTAIIRGACLAAVESVFTAWEEGGDLAASKMREEIRGLKTQLESCQRADKSLQNRSGSPHWEQEKTDPKSINEPRTNRDSRPTVFGQR